MKIFLLVKEGIDYLEQVSQHAAFKTRKDAETEARKWIADEKERWDDLQEYDEQEDYPTGAAVYSASPDGCSIDIWEYGQVTECSVVIYIKELELN